MTQRKGSPNAVDRLLECIDEKQNPCIVGLDPHLDHIPRHILKGIKRNHHPFEAVRDTFITFNKAIIDAVYDVVPAVKPQIAFYEKYGSEGMKAFEETVRYAKKKGLIVIEDAKRNDIGHTAQAYAEGHLGKVQLTDGTWRPSFDVDFMTVSPYLGSDGLKPFEGVCKKYGKGLFVLVKTSNPSSGELQDRVIKGKNKVYETIAQYVHDAGKDVVGKRGYSLIGAVVGATYPKVAKKLRRMMPQSIFLVPGFGAQGAGGKDVVSCFNEDGYGAVVNSSRDILFAYRRELYRRKFKPKDFALAAREAALNMREEVVKNLKQCGKSPL